MNTHPISSFQRTAKEINLYPVQQPFDFNGKIRSSIGKKRQQQACPEPGGTVRFPNTVEENKVSPLRPAPKNFFLERLLGLLEAHMDDETYCIHRLCRDAGISRTHLHKKLKDLTGFSTSMYIRMVKLQRAEELLVGTDLNISQVAFSTGYNDPTYFSRVFAQKYKVSPREYRKRAHN